MDPVACWERLLDACTAGDMAEAADAALDLDAWKLKGGCLPPPVPFLSSGRLRAFARVCLTIHAAMHPLDEEAR